MLKEQRRELWARRRLPRRYRDEASEPRDWTTAMSECGDRVGAPSVRGGGKNVAIFFSCEPTSGPAADAAPARSLSRDADLREALEALLAGPTKEEKRAGFFSNFGDETTQLPFDLHLLKSHKLLVIDLDKRILRVEFIFVSVQDVAQLAATAGQFPHVQWVVVRVGGKPLCAATGEC